MMANALDTIILKNKIGKELSLLRMPTTKSAEGNSLCNWW